MHGYSYLQWEHHELLDIITKNTSLIAQNLVLQLSCTLNKSFILAFLGNQLTSVRDVNKPLSTTLRSAHLPDRLEELRSQLPWISNVLNVDNSTITLPNGC